MIIRRTVVLLLFALAGNAWAGPDEEFAGVINLIQSADRLVETGKDRAAMDEYRKAQEALLKFRKVYPDWDAQVVDFRLRYLSNRLANWSEPDHKPAAAPDAEVEALRSRIGFLERSGQQYQAQINQLLSENSRLTSRLREALAIRPAAEDPAVVADTRLKLEKAGEEIARLKSRVEELETDLAATPNPEETRKNAKLLVETRKNLNLAVTDAETLRKENTALRAKANKKPAAPAEVNLGDREQARVNQSAAEIALQRLQQENERLKTQLAAVEKKPMTEKNPAPNAAGFKPVDRARLALADGRSAEAIRLLSDELESHQDHVEAWYLMGRARLAANDFIEAEAALKRALSLSPNLGAADVELARLYLRRSPSDPALSRWHYHKAMEHGFPRDEALERSIGWEQAGSSH